MMGPTRRPFLGKEKLKRHTDKVSQIVLFMAALTIYLVIVQQN
jgi:hypothetical protein